MDFVVVFLCSDLGTKAESSVRNTVEPAGCFIAVQQEGAGVSFGVS